MFSERNKVVLADLGYDSDKLRELVSSKGGIALIPGKANRKNPVFYLPEIGWHRRVVENFFARVKRHRRVNTRYDRLAETYIAFVTLAAIGVSDLSSTPLNSPPRNFSR